MPRPQHLKRECVWSAKIARSCSHVRTLFRTWIAVILCRHGMRDHPTTSAALSLALFSVLTLLPPCRDLFDNSLTFHELDLKTRVSTTVNSFVSFRAVKQRQSRLQHSLGIPAAGKKRATSSGRPCSSQVSPHSREKGSTEANDIQRNGPD